MCVGQGCLRMGVCWARVFDIGECVCVGHEWVEYIDVGKVLCETLKEV